MLMERNSLKLTLCLDLKVKLSLHTPEGGVEVYRCSFLTSSLDGDERFPSRRGRFIPMIGSPVLTEYGAGWVY